MQNQTLPVSETLQTHSHRSRTFLSHLHNLYKLLWQKIISLCFHPFGNLYRSNTAESDLFLKVGV